MSWFDAGCGAWGAVKYESRAGKSAQSKEKRCGAGESDAQHEETFGPCAQDSQIRRNGADLVRLTPDFQGQAHKIGGMRRGAPGRASCERRDPSISELVPIARCATRP
jgi:hypothetical protein